MVTSHIAEIDVPGSVLFVGSGFSSTAKNIKGNYLPSRVGLKRELEKQLGVEPDQYDLRTLADEYSGRPDLDLYQCLYELFTVKDLQPYHHELLRMPWRRIYTTNYDDAVEFAYQQNIVRAPSFNYDDPKPRKLTDGAIIHLHGVIRRATKENVLHQLVLNESSYVRQHFEKSPWYDDFVRDIRFCSNCFFVGYSLADYHITALLMENPHTREKTYFVAGSNPDRIFRNRVEQYGNVIELDTEGFASFCKTLPTAQPLTSPFSLKGFQYLDPFKDKRTLSPPTPNEVLNLVTFGAFNYQRCLSTLPRADYVAPRKQLVDEAIAHLSDAKCLLVHSRLGNGKSIFLYVLAHELSEMGYHCFLCRPEASFFQQDLAFLKTYGKAAIFFDSYNAAIDLLDQLAELPGTTKFVVTVRTGVQEVRLHEIQSRLPSPLRRVNLNGLRTEDIDDFRSLLDRSGARAEHLEDIISKCRDIREIVVTLYDNTSIKTKIQNELMPLLKDSGFKSVFVASHLLKWVGQDAAPAFLRSVTGRDAYAEMAKFREITGEIFRLDDDILQVRSAIFSEYLIQQHFTTTDLVESIYSILVAAVKRKRERPYQSIISSLIQLSTLRRALGNDPDQQNTLTTLFDRLHRDIDVNKEPLFWLQYTILMVDIDQLDSAERFMQTAYARAASSPGFQTYQIDTQSLRLLLLLEIRDRMAPVVARFDQIIEKLELVLSMIGDDSHRYYAVHVLQNVEPFVAARLGALSIDEKNALTFHLTRVVESLERLSPDARAQTGSDQVKASILRSKGRLTRP